MTQPTTRTATFVIIREGGHYGQPIAAGHAGACARELAEGHYHYYGQPAVVTDNPSRAAVCDWCHREADFGRRA